MAIPVIFDHASKDYYKCSHLTNEDYLKKKLNFSDYHDVRYLGAHELLGCKTVSPREQLILGVRDYLMRRFEYSDFEINKILNEIPTRWEVHGDLVLLPRATLCNEFWNVCDADDTFWKMVAGALKADRVALSSRVSNNQIRTPNVVVKFGAGNLMMIFEI